MFDKGLYIAQWIVLSAILFSLILSMTTAEAGDRQQSGSGIPTPAGLSSKR